MVYILYELQVLRHWLHDHMAVFVSGAESYKALGSAALIVFSPLLLKSKFWLRHTCTGRPYEKVLGFFP